MLDRFGLFQHALGRMLDVLEPLANALVGQRKNRVLGVIEDVLRLVFFFECLAGDLVCDFDQLAQQRFSPNNFGIRCKARRMGKAVCQVTQEEHTSRGLKRVVPTQFFTK